MQGWWTQHQQHQAELAAQAVQLEEEKFQAARKVRAPVLCLGSWGLRSRGCLLSMPMPASGPECHPPVCRAVDGCNGKHFLAVAQYGDRISAAVVKGWKLQAAVTQLQEELAGERAAREQLAAQAAADAAARAGAERALQEVGGWLQG